MLLFSFTDSPTSSPYPGNIYSNQGDYLDDILVREDTFSSKMETRPCSPAVPPEGTSLSTKSFDLRVETPTQSGRLSPIAPIAASLAKHSPRVSPRPMPKINTNVKSKIDSWRKPNQPSKPSPATLMDILNAQAANSPAPTSTPRPGWEQEFWAEIEKAENKENEMRKCWINFILFKHFQHLFLSLNMSHMIILWWTKIDLLEKMSTCVLQWVKWFYMKINFADIWECTLKKYLNSNLIFQILLGKYVIKLDFVPSWTLIYIYIYE